MSLAKGDWYRNVGSFVRWVYNLWIYLSKIGLDVVAMNLEKHLSTFGFEKRETECTEAKIAIPKTLIWDLSKLIHLLLWWENCHM